MKEMMLSIKYQMFVGVDSCKAGWFAVSLTEENKWQVEVFPDISSLWNRCKDARLILIDIPIGLLESGDTGRLCDIESRKYFSSRRSSVFRAPCRAAVQAAGYEDAKRINQSRTGKSLSIQTWGIIPKIREVDQFLNENITARLQVRETHPEVCFWSLNGGREMKYSKKKSDGFSERMEILLSIYPNTRDIVEYALSIYRRYEVAKDDILDAIAAAITASKEGLGISTLPENPEVDSKGLRMEMVYYLAI